MAEGQSSMGITVKWSWSMPASNGSVMPPFSGQSTCYWEGRDAMVVYGGVTVGKERTYVEGVNVLDLATLRWSRHDASKGPGMRSRHAACVVGDRMYVFGGDRHGNDLNDLWELSLGRMEWRLLNGDVLANVRLAGAQLTSWCSMSYLGALHDALLLRLKSAGLVIPLADPHAVAHIMDRPEAFGCVAHAEVALSNGSMLIVAGGGRSANWITCQAAVGPTPSSLSLRVVSRGYLEKGRAWHAACRAFDEYCFVYGGHRNEAALSDLLLCNKAAQAKWVREPPGLTCSPRGRIYASLCWSSRSHRIFLVGGEDSQFMPLQDPGIYIGELQIPLLQRWKQETIVALLIMWKLRPESCWARLSRDLVRHFISKHVAGTFFWCEAFEQCYASTR